MFSLTLRLLPTLIPTALGDGSLVNLQ
jgi:hypothetical protein